MAYDELYTRAQSLVQDRATFELAKHGIRKVWPHMNLAGEGYLLDPPDYNHLCEGSGVSQYARNAPHRQLVDSIDPRVPCIDCQSQGRRSVMHRLHCGHHLCRSCLGHRATCRMSRGQLKAETREAASRIYNPHHRAYARTRREKRQVVVGLWKRIGWTCCDEIIAFSDYMHREGCMTEDKVQEVWELWNNVIEETESVGNGVIMHFLEGYMSLLVNGESDVVNCVYPGLDISIRNPFQRTPENPQGILATVPILASRLRLLQLTRGVLATPSAMPGEGEYLTAPAGPLTEEETRVLRLLGPGP